ncbi:MAG: DUF4154 domain-containing protein [Alphaproteobacteria bacterium]|nr:DUF4154 domain-containing protein [Alphaproteobacteria bacterium]
MRIYPADFRLQQIRRCFYAISAAALLCLMPAQAYASDRQYKVEAAFLYSFFNYITWPGYSSPHALRNPVICVYGNDPILPYLEYVSEKMLNERNISVRTVSGIEAINGCHVFFVRHLTYYPISALLSKNIISVHKVSDPLDRGGLIDLSQDGERIVIRINQSLLEKHGFQVSSRLLQLAYSVK